LDTARQVVRWSIPGSVLVLTALAVHVASRAIQRIAGAEGLLLKFDSGAVALFALATVPLGYLIYQIYYSREGRVRHFPPMIVPVDRGHYILASIDAGLRDAALRRLDAPDFVDGLFIRSKDDRLLHRPAGSDVQNWPSDDRPLIRYHRLGVTAPAPRSWKARLLRRDEYYTERRTRRSDYYYAGQRHILAVRTLLAMVTTTEQGKALVIEYTTLSDIYHGLGATRTALGLGLPVGALVGSLGGGSLSSMAAAIGVVGPAALGLYYCVHINRSEVLRRLVGTAHYGLSCVLTDMKDAGEDTARATEA